MTEEHKNTTEEVNNSAERGGSSTRKGTQSAASRAKKGSSNGMSKEDSPKKASGALSAADARPVGAAAKHAGKAALSGVESGQQAVMSTASKAATAAATTWVAVRNRKVVAMSAAAGIAGTCGAAFALGRRTAKPQAGMLSKLTHGRLKAPRI